MSSVPGPLVTTFASASSRVRSWSLVLATELRTAVRIQGSAESRLAMVARAGQSAADGVGRCDHARILLGGEAEVRRSRREENRRSKNERHEAQGLAKAPAHRIQ